METADKRDNDSVGEEKDNTKNIKEVTRIRPKRIRKGSTKIECVSILLM